MDVGYYDIKTLFKDRSFMFLEGNQQVNPFGFRNEPEVDEFNDIIGVAYKDEWGNPHCPVFKGTTKPGLYWLGQDRMGHKDGTFILEHNKQFIDCWQVGKHKDYPAIQQKGFGIFTGWRDNNKDGQLDYSGKIYTDVTGLNGHTTSFINKIDKVGAYSAGCQVIQFEPDFQIWYSVLRVHSRVHGNSLNYALFKL